MRSDGERLDPKIQDFARWRDTIAHKARERNIPMENLRRFDQAHAPAYKLKDLKMMERGHAPESVRNRVERVNEREIFRPSRPEGVQSAAESTLHLVQVVFWHSPTPSIGWLPSSLRASARAHS